MTDSASALSYEFPLLPTDGSIPGGGFGSLCGISSAVTVRFSL
jgi:hypothetical protein